MNRSYFSQPTVSFATASEAVRLTIEEGHRRGLRLCAAVVDPALQMVTYGRADAMTPHSWETSRRKASTAASTGRPSAAVPEALATKLEHGTGQLLTSIPGGVPLIVDDLLIGGLGVAGSVPSDDAEVADVVLEALRTADTPFDQ